MKTPEDKTVVFTFGSHPMKDLALRWTARVTFPPGATAQTTLPIEIVDGHESPVCAGTFAFAGQRLAVADGAASISYSDFIAGKHEVDLWLYRPGCPPVPGGLTFA